MEYVYLIIAIIIILLIKRNSPSYKGYLGEKTVSKKLNKLNKNKYKVINNLLIKNTKGTSQIDHVVISQKGIYIIETKNYKGMIVGSEYDEYWQQIIYKRKEKFRNPIKQNYGHMKAVEINLGEYKEVPLIPIVVFANTSILKVKVDSIVVNTKNLLRKVRKYRKKVISKEEVELIYNMLLEQDINDKKSIRQHVKDVKRIIKENNKSIKMKKCPKCNGDLVVRHGRRGKFYGCSNYPKCRFSVDI